MNGKVLVFAAFLAALPAGGCGCTSETSSQPNSSPPLASLPGEQASASPTAPSVGLETTCALGFYDGSKLVPLRAANDQLPSAAKVTITNPSDTGVTLGGFVIEMWHKNHVFLNFDATHQAPNHLPFFLAPRASYRAVLQFNLLSGEGAVSISTYLHGTCTISTFNV